MSDALEKLRRELKAAQRALVEAETRLSRQEAEHQSAIKEAENTRNKIEQAHQDWLSALDAVESPIFAHDKDFHVLRCNRAYQRQAGLPFNQIIGRPYYELFPKTHAPLRNCKRATETLEDENDEELTVGGKTYCSHAATIKDGQDGYLYSIHLLEDITARKTGEIKLDLFRTLLDRSGDAIEVVDLETFRFVDGNETACRTLGYSREEFLSMGVRDVDPEVDELRLQQIRDALRAEGSIVFESRHRRKDGSIFPVEVSLSQKETDREYGITVVRDITEREKALAALQESKYFLQSILEAVPVRIFWKDRNLRYLGCNTRFARDAGLTKPEDLIGKDDFDMGWKDQAEGYRADDMVVMESDSPRLGIEETQTTPSGSTIWLRTSKVPLHDEGDRVIGVLGIYDDITEGKRAEAALTEQLEELRRWHDAMLGREERILELKHEVNALLGQAGQPQRYPSAESLNPKEE